VWGTVINGAGASADWMPSYFVDLYPGTLNLWMDDMPPQLQWHTSVDTHFGSPARLANVWVNGFEVFAVEAPLGRRGTRLLELGSTVRLRDYLNLENGDRVNVVYFV